jgi:hypothetical protein
MFGRTDKLYYLYLHTCNLRDLVEEMRCGNRDGRGHLVDLGIEDRILLTCILK